MGTYDSPCERHLYALPLTNHGGRGKRNPQPVRLTQTPCMHNVVMDHRLRRWGVAGYNWLLRGGLGWFWVVRGVKKCARVVDLFFVRTR